MEAVADLLEHDIEIVLTHGNGPQVGNLLVKNELAAAVVPPVPLDWCGASTQATLGFVLMEALDFATAAARPLPALGRAGHPHPGRRRRPGLLAADQADRPLVVRRGGGPADRARRALGGPRRQGLAPAGRVARAPGDPGRAGGARPGRRGVRGHRQRRRRDPGGARSRRAARRRGGHRQGPRRGAARPHGRRRHPGHRHRRPQRRPPLRHARGRAARPGDHRPAARARRRKVTSPAVRWGRRWTPPAGSSRRAVSTP